MILRKLAEAIREQNWFTVVLEILIVVIGIFVGLQVDGWNEVRKDRIKERVYLERLSRDIERDSALLDRSIRRAEDRAQLAVTALMGLADPTLIETDPCRFLASARGPSSNFFPVLYRHTFTEILSSGHLELIRSEDLKDELSQYYTAHDSAAQFMDGYRQINLDYTRAFAGVLSRDEIQEIRAFEDGEECRISTSQALAARQEILNRDGLADWLPRLELRQEALAERLERSLNTNERLREILSQELTRFGKGAQ